MPMMPQNSLPSTWPATPATPDPAETLSHADASGADDAPQINAAPPRGKGLSAAALDAFMNAASVALDLPLDPAYRPGVLRYLGLAAAMAQQLDAIPLSERVEPAVRFEPVCPPTRVPHVDTAGAA